MAKKEKFVYEWPRPMVTVDSVIFRRVKSATKHGQDARATLKIEVLLIKRGNEPYKGCWSLPGGFIEMDEELEDAAARELKEETGLSGVKLTQMRTYGTVGRDPRGRQISVAFLGIVKGNKKAKAGDDAADVKWVSIKKLPEKMGFDHCKIISDAKKVLKLTEKY
jgi:8-oxo-dGTP diphosphatase